MLRRRYGRAAGLVWLAFLGFPLAELMRARVSALHLAVGLLGVAVFVAVYGVLLLGERFPLRQGTARTLVFVLVVVAVAMTAFDRTGWAGMLVYAAAAMSFRRLFTERVAVRLVFACTGAAALLSLLRGASLGTAITIAVTCTGVGLLVISLGQLRSRNAELLHARDELARLAVAEERLRFARDLHDLLGHSLSVIALKAELAGRLIECDLDTAAAHVGELETVARGALKEVREAVTGYRRPVLAAELDGARTALDAAGIEAQLAHPEMPLSAEVEALLAWTVREGATNVIRHSGARSCRVAIGGGHREVSVEISDDGRGPDCVESVLEASPGHRLSGGSGHGLAGLRERAELLDGRLEAGAGPDGGFRLCVRVPLPELGAAT